MEERLDWGTCEQDGQQNMRLFPVVHHPTGVIVWLCAIHLKTATEAISQNQVPSVLGDKLQAYLNKKVSEVSK